MLSGRHDDVELRVAMASHDLRGPLHAMKLGLDILRHARLGPVEAQLVQRIYSSATRMAALVDSFLDSAALKRAVPIVVQRTLVDLVEVCRETLDEMRMGHPDREITLMAERGVRGFWDRLRVAELLTNLIENAFVHGDPSAPVLISVRGKGGGAEIEVVNHGPDIPPESLATIFEPFRRLSTVSRHGIGLGLYIAAQIVSAHGGTIEVSSAAGITRFTVTLARE